MTLADRKVAQPPFGFTCLSDVQQPPAQPDTVDGGTGDGMLGRSLPNEGIAKAV
jgi:hypothetical protein